jgi:ribosomal protein S18 acetylase RimI-like enzyme
MIAYLETPPTADEWNALRESVGWGRVSPTSAAERAVRNSFYFVQARDGARVVGVARIVGDGGNAFYIQDVIVHPDLQHRGIGSEMMDRVMRFLETIDSDTIMICLMSAKGKEAFYRKYGFIDRPNEIYGAGMIQFRKPALRHIAAE